MNFAHVKWFNTAEPISQPSFNILELMIAIVIVACGLYVFKYIDTWLKNRRITQNIDKQLKPFRPWVPLVVRLSAAALLLINYFQNFLLAPNVTTSDSTLSTIIGVVFLGVAALLILGLFNKLAIAALLVGYVLVLGEASAIDVLDHFEYIGIAGYLWLRGPGKYSLDSYLAGGKLNLPKSRNYSLDAYRIGVGIGLGVLALSEKLLNVTAAQNFLNQYHWNLLSGLGVSDRYFILIAGSIELLVGVALILNYAPRLLVLTVLALMTATALLLGLDEIYGHLFAVGIVVAVLVNDRKPGKTS